MNVGELLRGQYTQGHQLLSGVMADVGPDVLNNASGLGTLGSIGSIFAHMVFTEDLFVSGFTGKPPIYSSAGWDSKLAVPVPGIQQNADWAATVRLDLEPFLAYAKEVWAATEDYAGGLSEADLEREVPGLGGRQVKLAMLAANVGTIHISQHMGEIAAIKGMRGLKGLPF
jgi:hypothetical protein